MDKALRKRGAFCRVLPAYYIGADREALQFSTSTAKPLRPAILIATLLQHRTDLGEKPPGFEGGSFRSWQRALVLSIFALFSSKNAHFMS